MLTVYTLQEFGKRLTRKDDKVCYEVPCPEVEDKKNTEFLITDNIIWLRNEIKNNNNYPGEILTSLAYEVYLKSVEAILSGYVKGGGEC